MDLFDLAQHTVAEGRAAMTVIELSVTGDGDPPAGPDTRVTRWSRRPATVRPRPSVDRLALVLLGVGIAAGGAVAAAVVTATGDGPVAQAAGDWTLSSPVKSGEDRIDGMRITVHPGGTYHATVIVTDGRDREQSKLACDGSVDDRGAVLFFAPYAASTAEYGCAAFTATRVGDELTITTGYQGLVLHRG